MKAESTEKVEGESDFDFSKNVEKLIKALSEKERKVALVTGEATMWIYKLYNRFPQLTNVASFVEILDEPTEEENEEATSQSESVKLVGKARDAIISIIKISFFIKNLRFFNCSFIKQS